MQVIKIKSFIFSCIIVIIYALNNNPAYAGLPLFFCYASLTIPLYSFCLYYYTRESKHLFIIPTLIITWIYFQLPYLKSHLVYHHYRIIPEDYLNEMLIFSSFGILSLSLGYYYTFNKRNIKPITSENFKLSFMALEKVILFFILLRVISIAIPVFFQGIGRILQVIDFAPTIVFALLVYYKIKGGKSILIYIVSFFYISLEFFYFVAQTLFTYVALIFVGGLIIYILEKKKIPIITIIIFIVLTYPIYSTRSEFRYSKVLDRWYGDKEMTYLQIVGEGISNILEISNSWNYQDLFKSNDKKDQTEEQEDRTEQVSYLGQCVYMHEIVGNPYLYGQTFWWLPLTPIPRVIFPAKPVNEMQDRIAVEYGLKGATSKGAMNFPMLVEYYINFGFIGIVILSFFQGAALKWTVRKTAFGVGDINFLILLNLLFYFLKIEGNITLVFGAIIQIFLFWYILLAVLKHYGKMFNS